MIIGIPSSNPNVTSNSFKQEKKAMELSSLLNPEEDPKEQRTDLDLKADGTRSLRLNLPNLHMNSLLPAKDSVGNIKVQTLLLRPQMELSPQSPIVQSIFHCDICKSEFKNTNALRRHSRSVHIKPEPCPYCSKLMKSQGRPDNNRKHLLRCQGFQTLIESLSDIRKKEFLHYVVRELTNGRGYLLHRQ